MLQPDPVEAAVATAPEPLPASLFETERSASASHDGCSNSWQAPFQLSPPPSPQEGVTWSVSTPSTCFASEYSPSSSNSHVLTPSLGDSTYTLLTEGELLSTSTSSLPACQGTIPLPLTPLLEGPGPSRGTDCSSSASLSSADIAGAGVLPNALSIDLRSSPSGSGGELRRTVSLEDGGFTGSRISADARRLCFRARSSSPFVSECSECDVDDKHCEASLLAWSSSALGSCATNAYCASPGGTAEELLTEEDDAFVYPKTFSQQRDICIDFLTALGELRPQWRRGCCGGVEGLKYFHHIHYMTKAPDLLAVQPYLDIIEPVFERVNQSIRNSGAFVGAAKEVLHKACREARHQYALQQQQQQPHPHHQQAKAQDGPAEEGEGKKGGDANPPLKKAPSGSSPFSFLDEVCDRLDALHSALAPHHRHAVTPELPPSSHLVLDELLQPEAAASAVSPKGFLRLRRNSLQRPSSLPGGDEQGPSVKASGPQAVDLPDGVPSLPTLHSVGPQPGTSSCAALTSPLLSLRGRLPAAAALSAAPSPPSVVGAEGQLLLGAATSARTRPSANSESRQRKTRSRLSQQRARRPFGRGASSAPDFGQRAKSADGAEGLAVAAVGGSSPVASGSALSVEAGRRQTSAKALLKAPCREASRRTPPCKGAAPPVASPGKLVEGLTRPSLHCETLPSSPAAPPVASATLDGQALLLPVAAVASSASSSPPSALVPGTSSPAEKGLAGVGQQGGAEDCYGALASGEERALLGGAEQTSPLTPLSSPGLSCGVAGEEEQKASKTAEWWEQPIPREDPELTADEIESLLLQLPRAPAVIFDRAAMSFYAIWRLRGGVIQRRRCDVKSIGAREAHRQAVQTLIRVSRRPPGVVYDSRSRKWSVCVTRHNGRHRASFSVKKFGFEGAHRKAIEWYEAKRIELGLKEAPCCAETDMEFASAYSPEDLLQLAREAPDAVPPAVSPQLPFPAVPSLAAGESSSPKTDGVSMGEVLQSDLSSRNSDLALSAALSSEGQSRSLLFSPNFSSLSVTTGPAAVSGVGRSPLVEAPKELSFEREKRAATGASVRPRKMVATEKKSSSSEAVFQQRPSASLDAGAVSVESVAAGEHTASPQKSVGVFVASVQQTPLRVQPPELQQLTLSGGGAFLDKTGLHPARPCVSPDSAPADSTAPALLLPPLSLEMPSQQAALEGSYRSLLQSGRPEECEEEQRRVGRGEAPSVCSGASKNAAEGRRTPRTRAASFARQSRKFASTFPPQRSFQKTLQPQPAPPLASPSPESGVHDECANSKCLAAGASRIFAEKEQTSPAHEASALAGADALSCVAVRPADAVSRTHRRGPGRTTRVSEGIAELQ